MSGIKKHGSVYIELAGNFAPEWRQLVDAVKAFEGNDASVADAAKELVECVLYVTDEKEN